MKIRLPYIILLLSTLLLSCEKEEQGSFMVFTGQTTYVSEGGMNFQGRLQMDASISIIDHGFIISPRYAEGTPDTLSLGLKSNNGNFSYIVYNGLIPGKDYQVKAFAKSKNQILLGDKIFFKPLDTFIPVIIEVFPETAYINDTITLITENLSPLTENWKIAIEPQKATILDSGDSITSFIDTDLVLFSDSIIQFILPDRLNHPTPGIFFKLENTVVNTGVTVNVFEAEIDSLNSSHGYPGDEIKIYGNYLGNTYSTKLFLDGTELKAPNVSKDSISFLIPTNSDKDSIEIMLEIFGRRIILEEKIYILNPIIEYIAPSVLKYTDTISIHGSNFFSDENRKLILKIRNNIELFPISVEPNEIKFILGYINLYSDSSNFEVNIDINGRVSDYYSLKIAPPEIDSFSTKKLRYSEEFSIYGSNFNKDLYTDLVYINDTWLEVTNRSANKLEVLVPDDLQIQNPSPVVVQRNNENVLSKDSVEIADFEIENISFILGSSYKTLKVEGQNFSSNPIIILNEKPISSIRTRGPNEFWGTMYYRYWPEGEYTIKIQDNSHEETIEDPIFFKNPFSFLKDFPDGPRANILSYNVKDKAYIGGGTSDANNADLFLSDFWEYNPENDSWIRKADLPEALSSFSFSFNTENYCYYGVAEKLWKYDPINDIWERKSDFPLPTVYNKITFAIKDNGYVGGGKLSQYKFNNDYYKYIEAQDIWMKISSPTWALGEGCFANTNHPRYGVTLDRYWALFGIYDSELNTWRVHNTSPVEKCNFYSVSNIGDDFYFTYSLGNPELSWKSSYTIFNVITKGKTNLGRLPGDELGGNTSFRIGNIMYYIGGYEKDSPYRTFPYVIKYDPLGI